MVYAISPMQVVMFVLANITANGLRGKLRVSSGLSTQSPALNQRAGGLVMPVPLWGSL